MSELVRNDDVVNLTAVAELTCGQIVQVPDGRIGIVVNARPVAIGEIATVKVRGVVAITAAAALTTGALVGVHIANQNLLAAGAAGTVAGGTLLYTVADTATAYVDLNVFSKSTQGIGVSTAAAGSTTADAGVLPAGIGNVYLTSAADDTKGVRVHATDKVTGRTLHIANGVSNKILKVYPASGGTINGAAADAAFSSVSGKGVIIICVDSTANTWAAF